MYTYKCCSINETLLLIVVSNEMSHNRHYNTLDELFTTLGEEKGKRAGHDQVQPQVAPHTFRQVLIFLAFFKLCFTFFATFISFRKKIQLNLTGLQRVFTHVGHYLCKFMRTKKNFCITKRSSSLRSCLEHQYGRRFIVLEH